MTSQFRLRVNNSHYFWVLLVVDIDIVQKDFGSNLLFLGLISGRYTLAGRCSRTILLESWLDKFPHSKIIFVFESQKFNISKDKKANETFLTAKKENSSVG